MARILICDDEQRILDVLNEYCQYNGYETDMAHDGLEALDYVEKNNYDCIIIDIMMPNMDGFETIEAIKEYKNIPIIIISAKTEEYDILKGFSLGVDDYVCKPFSPKQIMARIKALLNRTGVKDYIQFENLRIDTLGREVYIDGVRTKLTNKEYDLLIYLIKNKGLCISRTKLLNTIWTTSSDSDERTVDTHIKMLRADLKEYSKFIVTVRGVGYKFDDKN